MKEPMLAFNETVDLSALPYPLLASTKMDGMRGVITPHGPRTRSMKRFTTLHVEKLLSTLPAGLDGEIGVVGSNGAVDFRATVSKLRKADAVVDFKFFVFDKYDHPGSFEERHLHLSNLFLLNLLPDWAVLVEQYVVHSAAEVKTLFEKAVASGHEGLILRRADAPYKFGRSTLKEAGMLKVKPWENTEAMIIGMTEEMKNNNEATRDERGKAKRSSAKAGKTGKGRMGTLILSDLTRWPRPFECGTGFTAYDREEMWNDRENIIMKMYARIKFIDVGGYDVPRSCVFDGLRPAEDMGL
jgi:DNA ligase-1